MTTSTIAVTLDRHLRADLDRELQGGNRSAAVSEAIAQWLDRRRVAAAAQWHASLTGDDAAAFVDFDSQW
jgi:metal-responsive CopG/Arc/MetJ family transcriptional regulator